MAGRPRSISLIQTFVIVSAAVLGLGGFALASSMHQSLERGALEGVEVSLGQYVDGVVGPNVVDQGELVITPAGAAALERALTSRDDLISIKLWDLESTVLWTSLGQERAGQRFEANADLQQLLSTGQGMAERDSLEDPEQALEAELGYDNVIEAYIPIFDEERNLLGAYEIYSDATRIDQLIASEERNVWLVTVAVFAGLWLLLTLLVRGASRTMKRQATSLETRSTQLTKALRAETRARTQAEQAQSLLRERERYRDMVEESPDTIAVHRSGTILFVNAAGLHLLGHETTEDIIGRQVSDLIVHSRPATSSLDDGAHRGDSPPRLVEMQLRRADGSVVEVEMNERPTMFDGQPASQITARDITERKRVEQQRTQFEERLQQALKMEAVGRLAGGIAHDFNNLLAVIGGNRELLSEQLPNEFHSTLEEVQRAADHGARLTQRLLAFSRQQVLQPTVIDLNSIVYGIEDLIRPLLGEDIELQVHAQASPALVLADRTQLEQVLLNLAANARDAMPAGGTVTLRTALMDTGVAAPTDAVDLEPGRYVVLSVGDTGIGMSQELLSHVFEPFFTTKSSANGTGLGLATAYGIVRQSGGELAASSSPGVGSIFRAYFPVTYTSVEESPAPTRIKPGALAEGFTVLLAEDNPSVRRVLERGLRGRGVTVLSCVDGQDAVCSAREYDGQIDALVTDLVMPQLGGRDAAEQLRSLFPGIGVVFMSGYAYDNTVASDESGSLFLQKPFRIDELIRQLSNLAEAERLPRPRQVQNHDAYSDPASTGPDHMSTELRRIGHDLSNAAMVIDSSIRLIRQGRGVAERCEAAAAASDRLYELTAELDGFVVAWDPEVRSISDFANTSSSFANRS